MITRAACTRLGFTLAFTIALGFALGLSTSSPRDEPASRAAPADAKEVIPVWWNRAELPEIQTVADCEGAWVTWRPNSEVPAHAHTVELTMPSGQLVEAKSCAEWRVLTDAGGYAYSTFNVSMEGQFSERAALYSAIPHLKPARRSGFAGKPWASYARSFLTADDACLRGVRVKFDQVEWEVAELQIDYRDESTYQCAKLLARGDFNGDGWEDLILSTGGGAVQGSMRGYSVMMFTRRESDRVIDISAHLSGSPLSEEAMELHRRQIAASFGLPEGQRVKLRGVIGTVNGGIPVTADLLFVDGLVKGSYVYDRIGTPIPIEGSLGDGSLSLSEFLLGNQPNAQWSLTWALENGVLKLEGYWSENLENNPVTLTGALSLPQTQPARAPTTAAKSVAR